MSRAKGIRLWDGLGFALGLKLGLSGRARPSTYGHVWTEQGSLDPNCLSCLIGKQ